jgi:hypothetical protein
MTPFVRVCVQSWRLQHPSWDVIVLDINNVWKVLDATDLPQNFLQFDRASLQADAVRVSVLARYGGCYVDASTLALSDCVEFSWDLVNRGCCMVCCRAPTFTSDYLSAWFIVAKPREPLFVEWSRSLNALFEGRASDKDIHLHDFFKDIDLWEYTRWDPLADNYCSRTWVEYLAMNIVQKAILDRDAKLHEDVWQRSVIFADHDESVGPTAHYHDWLLQGTIPKDHQLRSIFPPPNKA